MTENPVPKFIKEFSKEKSADNRRAKAAEIRAKRNEYFGSKKDLLTKKEGSASELVSIEKEAAEKAAALKSLQRQIESLSESGLDRIKNYFTLRKMKADAVLGEASYESLLARQRDATAAKEESERTFDKKFSTGEKPQEFTDARKLIRDFYEVEKAHWANSDYAEEDLARYFKEERLESLSLEDYALFLRRFPGQMVTHVTRQGIRDHIGNSMMHSLGQGAYADGFMKIVENGRLQSPLGIVLTEKEKDDAIAKYLLLDMYPDKEAALRGLHIQTSSTSQGDAGTYADKSAIHTATEMVADAYYGSEHGNEIFFAFPSAQIASQYFFQTPTLEEANEDSMRNDQWIWVNEQRGIPINSGLVFIPEKTMVDAATGSQYQLDSEKNPVINQEYLNTIVRLANAPNFPELKKHFDDATSVFNTNQDPELKELHQILEQEYGITDPSLQNFILDYETMFKLSLRRSEKEANMEDYKNNTIEQESSQLLFDSRLLFMPAKNGIPAKDFWENYFSQHPEQKPSKIVYYQEEDPTLALRNWRIKNGIDKRSTEGDLGFRKNMIEPTNPIAIPGMDRFRDIATDVIERYFANKEGQQAAEAA